MFVEIIISIIIGILFGIITGLTPGIHVNLISVMCVGLSPILLGYTNVLSLACFIIALSVTHSFLDSIPSVFLGAPESATALGVLPGHRYLLKGQGMMAVKLTIVGSFGAMIFSCILFVFLIPVVKYGYPLVEGYIGYMLIVVVLYMILRDNKKIWASLIFFLSGVMGLIVFNIPNFKEPMFAMFSGMFGVSTLLYSLNQNETIPEQKDEERIKLKNTMTAKALSAGVFSGFITAVMPGLGAATAAVIGMNLVRKIGDHGFMILIGAINTVNFILSMVTLLVLGKARNGAIIVVQKLVENIDGKVVFVFLLSSLIAGSISVFLALKFARLFSKLIIRFSYRNIVIAIIELIIILVIIISGWKGIVLLVVATAVGLIPAVVKTSRTHGMGCLLLPVIMYFII